MSSFTLGHHRLLPVVYGAVGVDVLALALALAFLCGSLSSSPSTRDLSFLGSGVRSIHAPAIASESVVRAHDLFSILIIKFDSPWDSASLDILCVAIRHRGA